MSVGTKKFAAYRDAVERIAQRLFRKPISLLVSFIAVFLCIMLLLPVWPGLSLQIHEFGHGVTALIIAQSTSIQGEQMNISWVYSLQGPVQTRVNLGRPISGIALALFSMAGALSEILFALVVTLVILCMPCRFRSEIRNLAALAFFVSQLFMSVAYSVVFADTDGFAFFPRMHAAFGVAWDVGNSILICVVLVIQIVAVAVSLTLILSDALDRLGFFERLNSRAETYLTRWLRHKISPTASK